MPPRLEDDGNSSVEMRWRIHAPVKQKHKYFPIGTRSRCRGICAPDPSQKSHSSEEAICPFAVEGGAASNMSPHVLACFVSGPRETQIAGFGP
jgi:hypothetical protein